MYRIEFTERAATQRDALPEASRRLLGRGMAKFAEAPFTPVSQAVGGEDIRVVSVVPGLTVRYLVHRAFLIPLSLALLDQSLIDEWTNGRPARRGPEKGERCSTPSRTSSRRAASTPGTSRTGWS